jgi:OPT oligopeptide transporter protein
MIEVKSVMLFSVGMYLPLGTTFAIFVGGLIRWATDRLRDRRDLNDAQKARVDNAGVLTASGLIAGEALCGIAVAAIIARRLAQDPHADTRLYQFAIGNYGIMSVIALAVMVAVMIFLPLANAGRPEDPAPPTAIM